MALNASPYSDDATPSSLNIDERPTTLRTETIPGSISDTGWESTSPTDIIPPEVEAEMSEEQLRVLYDDEEIDRFLHLFSAYVTEVTLPGRLDPLKGGAQEQVVTPVDIKADPKLGSSEDGDWITIGEDVPTSVIPTPSLSKPSRGIAEYIAQHYMIPSLPPAPLPPPPFSLGRLRVTSQRLYLAVQPAYGPFFSTLAQLATWKDRSKSLLFCTVFWTLWWYNLLLPALFLRTFYALIRRKIFSYPTVRELRERRAEVARASVFGDEVQARLMPSSPFGLTELWRIFKVFNKPKVDKAKDVIKESSNAKGKGKSKESTSPDKVDSQSTREAPTVLDGSEESSLDTDSKRAIIQSLAEIADLHERVKNIAIWRRPASSYFYSGLVLFLAILTSVLPAKYIAKLGCAVGGFMFWHVTPVLAAMSAADRSRMPPALDDVPTDSDYAMDLISQRVASGLHVKPTPLQRSKRTKMRSSETGGDDTFSVTSKEVKSIDWKRWGDRAALGKAAFARTPFGKATLGPAWSDDEKRLQTGTDWRQTGTWPPRNPLIPASILLHGAPTPRIETHTFPAHGKAGPGLITVTSSTLYFTPLISASAIITIPFSDLRGIKKTGILKGLSIRWTETEGASTEKEEKFMWVGDRDELFARLIGPGGRRWLKV